MRIPKNNSLLENARNLRREMTPQERKLWYLFLRKYPVKIYKQRIVGMYIADFYCASARTVIEIDGSQHYDVEGRRKDAERQPRPITIHELTLLGMEADGIHLRVRCSKGTYIRTLCKDIGEALGCGGCMAALRRVTAGEYTIEESVPLQRLLETETPEEFLRPVDSMFRNYPAVTLTEKQELRCRNGNSFSISLPDGTYRAYGKDGEFLALSKAENSTFSTIKSFFDV